MRSDLAMAALASAAVPGMKPVAVAGVTVAGDVEPDHQQAIVEDATGRRWLVRCPLTAVGGARLERNDDLVRGLGRHLPFKVPVPVGYASAGAAGRAPVFPYVEGLPLDLERLPAGPGLASAVGRAIAAVHNVPRGVFEEHDVPIFDAAGCRQRLIAEVDRAAETGRVPTGLLARWEEAFDAAPLWQFATTPVHGAFRGSTVLVAFGDDDAGSGRVVAVTDWEEAMLGDPAVDLADVCSRAEPAAWESVLDSYALARAQRPDPYLHARARLVAETGQLRGLAHAVGAGLEEVVRRIVEGLRRTDRLTEDADSLVPTTARGAGSAGTSAAELTATDEPETDRPTSGTGTRGTDDASAADLNRVGDSGAPRHPDAPAGSDDAPVTDVAGQDGEPGGDGDGDGDATISIPVQTRGRDGAEPPADTGGLARKASPDPVADDLDADERLHELYGMPDDDADRGR